MSITGQWIRWSTASTNRKIFSATAIIVLLTLGTKFVSMGKDFVVAAYFGTGDALDAFFMAFLLPAFIINVVGGSFNAALIPTYIQVREKEGLIAAKRLFSSAMVLSIGLLAIATLVIVFAAPYYLPLVASGFSSEKMELTRRLLYVFSPIIVLCGVKTMWGAVLNAGEQFSLVAISPVITPVVNIFSLAFCNKSWGIMVLTVGTVCGMALESILLAFALKRQGIFLFPRWHGIDGKLRQVMGQYLPMISGSFLMSSTVIVDQAMAAMLGPGSVSALNYGNKLIAFPIGLAITGLGTAVVPYFSKMVACKDWIGIRNTLRRYLVLIFSTTIPLTIGLFFCSEYLVRIVYQRGLFTAEDTRLVSHIQSLYAIQIPFCIAGILVVRLISSMLANYILMIANIISVILNVVLNYLFMKKIGVAGIALSTSCVYIVACLFLYLSWWRLSGETE
ncbi:MAG: murein biosynthesis integral membrane protein MurJ [Candidatus Scalindua sp.]|nr:murein biosynthesis integral membrane protein MurJ [Candidatus Scalindua sp.]